MFRGFEGLTGIRKWNLLMVIAIFSCILTQKFVGHIVAVNDKLELATTIFGVGLVGGFLFQLWQKKHKP